MAKLHPPKREPAPVTYRDVPAGLGKGRVSLYDSAVALPSLLEIPVPALLKKCPWVLVHFPSRRHVLVKSKAAGLEVLREIHAGKDSTGVVPKAEKDKGKRSGGDKERAKPEKSKAAVPAQARARAKKAAVEEKAGGAASQEEESPADSKKENFDFTVVPPGMTFDQAMQFVFPPQRLTMEMERLLRFKKKIITREGDELGDEDEPFVQGGMLKNIISYHQGRPAEKEKPPPEKKRVSYDELKTLVLTSDAALEYMERLVQSARAARTDATNPAPPLKPS